MEEKYNYSIVFEENDEEVIRMLNKVNDALQSVIDTNPYKGSPTIFDIGDITDKKAFCRIDYNMVDIEHPKDEQRIRDVVTTVLTALGYRYSVDNMPNVDYNQYLVEIEVEL